MKIMHIILLIIVFIFIYITRSYWLPVRVASVHQTMDYIKFLKVSYKSTIVIVDNPPVDKKGMVALWGEQSSAILNEYKSIESDGDEIIFLKNNPTSPYDKQELKHWIGDNQYCLNGELKGSCISKTEAIFKISVGNKGYDNKYIGNFNGKRLYIQFIEY